MRRRARFAALARRAPPASRPLDQRAPRRTPRARERCDEHLSSTLRDVTKIYQVGDIRVQALRDVSLRVEHGDFVAIMGSSGSGKSTLMHILGCLDVPTSGRYLIDGMDVSEMDEDDLSDLRNRKIGFVFQSFNLVARTSAIANVELPLAYAGLGRAERRSRAADGARRRGHGRPAAPHALRAVGRPAAACGGRPGDRDQPRLILADEPTGNLDSRSTEDVLRSSPSSTCRGELSC